MFTVFQQELTTAGTTQFYVRARPGMSATKAVSLMADDSVKIDIAAVPEGGKANVALVTYLAQEFGVTKSHVRIVSGATARMKLVRITR